MNVEIMIGIVGGFVVAHLCAISIAFWLYWSVFRRSFVKCSSSNAVYKKVYGTISGGEHEMERQTRQMSTLVKQLQGEESAMPSKTTDAYTTNQTQTLFVVRTVSKMDRDRCMF